MCTRPDREREAATWPLPPHLGDAPTSIEEVLYILHRDRSHWYFPRIRFLARTPHLARVIRRMYHGKYKSYVSRSCSEGFFVCASRSQAYGWFCRISPCAPPSSSKMRFSPFESVRISRAAPFLRLKYPRFATSSRGVAAVSDGLTFRRTFLSLR